MPTPPSQLQEIIAAEPDLVDRIFDFIVAEHPLISEAVLKLKDQVRAEFAGGLHYVPQKSQTDRQQRVAEVLSLFNGRNATEVARQLGVGRTTVYRIIKQSGRR